MPGGFACSGGWITWQLGWPGGAHGAGARVGCHAHARSAYRRSCGRRSALSKTTSGRPCFGRWTALSREKPKQRVRARAFLVGEPRCAELFSAHLVGTGWNLFMTEAEEWKLRRSVLAIESPKWPMRCWRVSEGAIRGTLLFVARLFRRAPHVLSLVLQSGPRTGDGGTAPRRKRHFGWNAISGTFRLCCVAKVAGSDDWYGAPCARRNVGEALWAKSAHGGARC